MSNADWREIQSEEVVTAFHESGHAVAMWKLGFGVGRVSAEPTISLQGYAEPAFEYVEPANANEHTRRFVVEQTALYLHAGDVAARLLCPDIGRGQAEEDHYLIHRRMDKVESDRTVQSTWCGYLWQRSRCLLAPPAHWHLVAALAYRLIEEGALDGKEVERYLLREESNWRHQSAVSKIARLDRAVFVSSPWHRIQDDETRAAALASSVEASGAVARDDVSRNLCTDELPSWLNPVLWPRT